jgi:hypothetical protein
VYYQRAMHYSNLTMRRLSWRSVQGDVVAGLMSFRQGSAPGTYTVHPVTGTATHAHLFTPVGAMRWWRCGCLEYDLWGIPNVEVRTRAQFTSRSDVMGSLSFRARFWRTQVTGCRPLEVPISLHSILYIVPGRSGRSMNERMDVMNRNALNAWNNSSQAYPERTSFRRSNGERLNGLRLTPRYYCWEQPAKPPRRSDKYNPTKTAAAALVLELSQSSWHPCTLRYGIHPKDRCSAIGEM